MTKTGRTYAQADIDDVMDNPEITAEDVAAGVPFAEAFPELAANFRRGRGPGKKPSKERITLRIDCAVLDVFRATGDGWQTRINDVLKRSAAKGAK